MNAHKTLMFVAACCISLGSRAAPDETTRLRAIVDATVRPLMAENGIAGMAVGITVDDKAHYFHYGLASKEDKRPVNDATLFELGSVSKVLTATLASYAQVTGKLSLGDHPGKFLPRLAGSAIDRATILHFGTYTAGGLPLQYPDDVSAAGVEAYFRQFKPTAAPGVQRHYSNPSLGLFGQVSALALNNDFADAMEQQIFPQLGLKSSYQRLTPAAMENFAWGYNRAGKPTRMTLGVHAPEAYGVRSNVVDMVRFMQVNIEPALLREPMRRAVQGTQIGYFQVGVMVQGLGWEQYAYPVPLDRLLEGNSAAMIFDPMPAQAIASPQPAIGATLFNKTGSTGGFGTYIAFVPEKRMGIVLLANKNYPIPARVRAAHSLLTQLARQ